MSQNDFNKMWDDYRLDGNQEALTLIYYEHFDFLYDFALKYTQDRNLIEDCIQNIFDYLLKKRRSLSPVSNVRYYLLQSFRRELFRQMKRNKKSVFSAEVAGTPDQFCYNQAEDHMDHEERDRVIQLVQKSIQKLGAKQQEIIYLRFTQELDYAEIAKMLDISVESCHKSVYRSIKFIKEDIEKLTGNSPDLLLWIFVCIKGAKKINFPCP